MTSGSAAIALASAMKPVRLLELPIWPLLFFTLFDFYLYGVRPFDHLGVAIFLIAAIPYWQASVTFERMTGFLTLVILSCWFAVWGAFHNSDALKPSLGFLEGAVLALFLSAGVVNANRLKRGLVALMFFHSAALFVQLFLFYLFNYRLNYHASIGVEARTLAGVFGLRPAGLFQEPALYSYMMFSFLTLYRLIGGPPSKIELFGIITMLLSLSLWGWGMSILYLIMFRPRLALAFIPILIVATLFVVSEIDPEGYVSNLIFARSLAITSDGSFLARYGSLFSSVTSGLWTPEFLIGTGFTNEYLEYGSNGLAFILAVGGAFGTFGLFLVWLLVLPPGRKLKGLACLILMLSAAPQWTYMWWWAWLAMAATARNDFSDFSRAPPKMNT